MKSIRIVVSETGKPDYTIECPNISALQVRSTPIGGVHDAIMDGIVTPELSPITAVDFALTWRAEPDPSSADTYGNIARWTQD